MTKNPNENRTYIYTEECSLCGNTASYADIARKLQSLGKKVYTKQTTLWTGWADEARAIGLELPCVYDYDTTNKATVAELSKMEDDELKEWLGLGD